MGSIPTLRRCPPSLREKAAASSPKAVRVSHLVQSLEFIEKWAGEIASHLKKIEGDPVVVRARTAKKNKKTTSSRRKR